LLESGVLRSDDTQAAATMLPAVGLILVERRDGDAE
jgi:hypothetical protein